MHRATTNPQTASDAETAGPYSPEFFDEIHDGSRASATVVLPLVQEAVGARSIVDVGCGTGAWLAVARSMGITDASGVDGDYVVRSRLQFPVEHFVPADLAQPLALGRTFDLVMSLEVAEHLPEVAADTFVASLVSLGPVILFSAAIPLQGGVHHLNEQWPGYWVERFASHGYVAIDFLRPHIWLREDVEFWYRQNCFVLVRESRLDEYPLLREAKTTAWGHAVLPLVHPRMFLARATELEEERGKAIPRAFRELLVDRLLPKLASRLRGR